MKRILLILMIGSLLVANSIDEIKSANEIRVGLWKDLMPFSTLQGNEYVGFEADLAKKLQERILPNGKMVVVPINSPQERVTLLKENKVDVVIAMISKTEEYLKEFAFAMPYLQVPQAIMTKKDSTVGGLKDLVDKTAIVIAGSHGEDYVRKNLPSSSIVYSGSNMEGYAMLKDGLGDYYINDNLIILSFCITDDDVKVIEPFATLGQNQYITPAVSISNKGLLDDLNKAMIELSKEGFFQELYNKYFKPFYKDTLDPKSVILDDFYRLFG